MFKNVFLKTLHDMRTALFWWGIGLFGFSLLYMLFYPSVREDSAALQSMFDRFPEGIRAMVGGELDVSTVEGYLSLRVFSFYPFLTLAFGVTYGVGFIGNEEERGTLDLLLSTPVPRWRVVVDKFAALVIFTLVVLLAAYLGFVVGGGAVGVAGEMRLGLILGGVLNMAPLTLFFAALALCLNGIKGGRGLALGAVLVLAATTYLITTMAEIMDLPRGLQWLSPWYYYNGIHVLKAGLNVGYIALLLGLTAGLVGLAVWGFQRRDVGV